MNHDFCPQFNRYVYWLKKPIGWVFAAAVFSLVVGLMVGPQGYVMMVAFLTLLILGSAWPWLSMKGIRCEVVVPDDRASENQQTKIILRIQNLWPLPVFGMMVEGDFLQDTDDDDDRIAFSLKRIPAWSESEFSCSITPRRRGVLPSGEVRLVNGFPFGIYQISKPATHTGRCLVWPAVEQLKGLPESEGTQLRIPGNPSDRSGNDGDTIGVRTYRPGDRVRSIHWAQSIRNQRLMVRERQTLTEVPVSVVLDLTPHHHEGRGSQSSFEWAIRIAATISNQLHQNQSQVQLGCIGLSGDGEYSTNNRMGLRSLMDFLARLPAFEHVAELNHVAGNRTTAKHCSTAGQVFFVGTNRSVFHAQRNCEIQHVVIDICGFASRDQTESAMRKTARVADEPAISISTPRLAGGQLVSQWSRSFGHASH